MTKIGYIVGSLSTESMNRMLANALQDVAPEGFEFEEIEIANLPLYNRDYDADYPQVGKDLKAAIEGVDALIFVTPEYSRSMPAAIKNVLEWGGRPWGTNSFAGKPAGVIGMSPGGAGTSMAQQHLRNVLAHLDAPTMGQPEAFVQFNPSAWENGRATDESLREILSSWVNAFARHIERVRAADLATANV